MDESNLIEKQVLDTITPSDYDRKKLDSAIKDLRKKVTEELHKKNITATIELVGSTAKDTYLKDNLDIDLFIVYPIKTAEQTIASTTLDIGRRILSNTEECYAEHPYIRGNFQDFKVELVPCYQITNTSNKISSVDRTPFHTRYVKTQLQESQKQYVRLLKQFLKGIDCYGAEAEVQGLSGYLCELLIIKFNSFHQLLTQAAHWKHGTKLTLIDDPIPYFSDPFIFIDPVDKERNVAAAVAPHTFERFIIASKAYLQKPKNSFFFPKPLTPWSLQKIKETIQNQSASYIGISFTKPQIIKENLYPQIRKACKAIETASTQEGFIIHDILFQIDTKDDIVYLIIKTDDSPLSETFTHTGPPTKLKKNTKEFIEKWTDHPSTITQPFQENGRSYVTIKRNYRYLHAYLKENLTSLSLGRHLDEIVSQHYHILTQKDLLIPDLINFWTQYLENKKPWER